MYCILLAIRLPFVNKLELSWVEHDPATFNYLHWPWAPQCTVSQTDRHTSSC